jgi:hypothetical protein
LHLQHLRAVGELDQSRGAREQPGAEVGQDAEAEHVDAQLVDDLGEVLDLRGGVELGLVADQVVDLGSTGQLVDDVRPEAEVVVDVDGRVRQAEPAGQHRGARAVVADEDDAGTAAGGVVVIGLQRQGRLAGIHRARPERQCRHGLHLVIAGGGSARRRPSSRLTWSRQPGGFAA